MSKNTEQVEVILSCRTYLYKLLQVLFGNEPNGSIISYATGEVTFQTLSLFFGSSEPEVADFQSLLETVKSRPQPQLDELIGQLKDEYTRLFLGPAKLPSPPWQSAQVSQERSLLNSETLKVRTAYRRNGYLSSNYPHDPDDHIAIELDFMYRLAERSLQQFYADDQGDLAGLLKEQQNFLDENLLLWVRSFSDGLSNYSAESFYSITARFLTAFLLSDKYVIAEMCNGQ